MREALTPRRDEASPPRWLAALVAMAALAHVASFGWTFASHDFIRDLLAASDIANGQAFALRGPSINDMAHVGPLWFYVLALPLALGGGLVAATVWVGVLSTLKVWAAWRLGRALDGPRFGLLLAALSLMPGWSLVHQFQITQAIVLELTVYAALLPLLRLWRGDDGRAWGLAGLWLGLAVQSHPVGLFLLLPMLVVALRRWASWRRDLPWWLLGAALSVLPLLPMLWAEWRDGFPALGPVHAYLTVEDSESPWLAALGVVSGITAENAKVVIAFASQFGLGNVTAALFLVLFGLASLGLWSTLRVPRARVHLASAVLLTALCAVWLASLRATTPYYLVPLSMPFLTIAICTAIHGGGLTMLGRWRDSAASLTSIALAAVACFVIVAQGQSGRIDFPLGGLRDIAKGPAGVQAVATMPVWASERLAVSTCNTRALVLRGELAAFVDFYQGVPWIWKCDAPPRIALIGAPRGSHFEERVLMSPEALHQLGWPASGWSDATALAPTRVLSRGAPVFPPSPPRRYPHRSVAQQSSTEVTRVVVTDPGEALAVYAPLFVFDGGTVLGARVAGRDVPPRVSTNSGAVFVAPIDAQDGAVRWELRLGGRRIDQIEVFTLRVPIADDAARADLSP